MGHPTSASGISPTIYSLSYRKIINDYVIIVNDCVKFVIMQKKIFILNTVKRPVYDGKT